MKKAIIFLLIPISVFAQDAKTLIVHGDTLFLKNFNTGDSTQINKTCLFLMKSDTPAMLLPYQLAINGKQNSLGYTPYNTTNPNNYISTLSFAGLTGKPTTLAGYGITDAYPLSGNPSGFLVANDITGKLNTNGNGSALTGITPTQIGLSNVTNTSDANKPVSTAQQAALDLKANITSQTFVTPNIGVATGSSLAATGAITSSGGGIGYTTGNGGTVTQATNKSTGVTLNKLSGDITMVNSALAAAAIVSFTLTNSTIAATDQILVQHQTTGTFGAYTITGRTAAGSAVISIRNNTAGSLSEAIVIKFTVIKSSIN